jgi:ATP-binding cassette subfamily F protein 3
MITGELKPDSGTIGLGHNVQYEIFSQHQMDAAAEYGLGGERTVAAEFSLALTDAHRNINARSLLGNFGFPGEAAERLVSVCSGGEQTRLALAKLLVSPINLLMLDEPTNHLDMASADVLEDAIAQWPGTVLLVSHDRHLIDSVATHVMEVVDGRAVLREGGMDEHPMDWITTRRTDPNASIGTGRGAGPAKPKAAGSPENKADARRAAAKQRESVSARTNLTKNIKDLKKALGPIEKAVGTAESLVVDLTRQLGEPGVYDDVAKAATLVDRHGKAKEQASQLSATWEQLAEALETAESRLSKLDA